MAVLRRAVEEGDPDVVYQAQIALDDLGEEGAFGGPRDADITDVALNMNDARRYLEVATDDRCDLEPRHPLHRAALLGDLRRVDALLAAGADANARDAEGWTPLVHVALGNHVEVVRTLLAAGTDITASSNEGLQAIDLALAGDDRRPLLACLLDAGACFAADEEYPPVYLAAKSPALLGALLTRGADVNAMTARGESALSFAASWGHLASVEILLAWGADAAHAVPELDWSVLMFAAEGGHVDVVGALLDGGADATWANRHGRTALYVALDHRRIAVVERLLAACPAAARVVTFDPVALMQRVGEDVLAAQIAALRWSEPRGGLRARLKSRVEHASIVLEVLVENVSVESLVVQADDPMSLRVWAMRDGVEVRPSFERMDVMSSQRRTPLPPGEVLAGRRSLGSTARPRLGYPPM